MQDGVPNVLPRTDHQEEDGFREEEDVERAVAESLPKNLIAAHPVQGSRGICSPATPCVQRYGMGKAKGRLRCGRSEAKRKRSRLTEDFRFMAAAVRKKGSGVTQETVTDAISSPPP